jgi:hypothetical protein
MERYSGGDRLANTRSARIQKKDVAGLSQPISLELRYFTESYVIASAELSRSRKTEELATFIGALWKVARIAANAQQQLYRELSEAAPAHGQGNRFLCRTGASSSRHFG